MENERLIAGALQTGDIDLDTSLRPRSLKEYYGQEKVKESLSIYINAALRRHDALDHMLLYGPPGLGKTCLAGIVAAEMGQNIRITSGPAIERAGDLASILVKLEPGDLLFVLTFLSLLLSELLQEPDSLLRLCVTVLGSYSALKCILRKSFLRSSVEVRAS